MSDAAVKMSPLRQTVKKNVVLTSFLLAAAVAFVIFLPFVIADKGFFVYTGDYNLQQIPFYMYVQQFIKNGGGTWSWATDIGSSVVNSYSFYNIGSPFLWITMLFPSRWMPYLMVPLFILKFSCIAAAAALYLKRYAKTSAMPVICSLLYAFCSFNVYNIFFNHMLDAVVFFPLMLWAMDGFVYEQKRGWFALFVGLALLNSYFFFIGNVVFLLIYFFAKVALKEYRLNPKQFGFLVLEALLGVGIGMALALPSFFNLMGNPRTDNFSNGMNLVMYWNVQQYFNIFTSLIFPPDPPWWPNLFTEGAIKHTSMTAFLPVIGISGVVAYFKARKKSSIKAILIVCAICALVPFFNSAFYAFNASYYARWYYMPIFIMCFASMRSLEDEDIDLVGGAKITLLITATYAIFGVLPTIRDGVWQMGAAQDAKRFWLTYIVALIGIGMFYMLLTSYRGKVKFAPLLLAAVMGYSAFYSIIHLGIGKIQQWNNDSSFKSYMYDASGEIELPEGSFYRIDTFGTYDNMGLWMNKSGLQTFNSVVTPSIMEFYPMVGVKRDVSSQPSAANYALRGLLSVQYTLVPLDKIDVPIDAIPATREQLGVSKQQYALPYTQIPAEIGYGPENLELGWAPDADGKNYIATGSGGNGWRYFGTQGGYVIFENENFVPLGFTYNQYIEMDHLLLAYEGDRANLLMHGIGLTEEHAAQYGHLFGGEFGTYLAPATENNSGVYDYTQMSYSAYAEACDERRMESSYDSSYDSSGFTCKINMEQENLVFFGVPYDEGFNATVNGIPAEVLRVSGGMMAVAAPAGDNTIVFRYKTPGFGMGLSISAVCIALLCLYVALFTWGLPKKKTGVPAAGKSAKAALPANAATGTGSPGAARDGPGQNQSEETAPNAKTDGMEENE